MIEVVALIPTKYNDGSKVDRKTFDKIEDLFVEEFGGFTDTGKVIGKWKGDDGIIYRDISKRYEIAIEPADTEKFKQIIAEAGRLTKQLAMYIKVDNVPEILEIK